MTIYKPWLIQLGFSTFFLSTLSVAGSQPLFGLQPTIKAPNTLARNAAATAVYQITNNLPGTRTLTMMPIQGVEQVTTTSGSCGTSFSLATGQSCLLHLRIQGSQMPTRITSGPVVCQLSSTSNSPNPFACSQPAALDKLNVLATPSETPTGNTWISVLIAQDSPPADLQTYVNDIKNLAPALDQLHLRFNAGATNYQEYADLIAMIRTAYPSSSFQIGFHPDNSNSHDSYTAWGCTYGDWQCVLNKSIIAMNNINAIADPHQTGIGFNIFSLEQSYVEIDPITPEALEAVKACLNPAVAAPGAVCPAATIASPVVKFGDVLQSYGGSELYGTDKLDYGYPQYYNLEKAITSEYSALITTESTSYFPPYSAANCIGSASYPYKVVDVDTNNVYSPPKIPCFSDTPDIYTYSNPPDPTLPAAYMGYLLTQYPPLSNAPDTNGSTVYITFSGETDFLGAPGWTLDKLNQFNQDLDANFTRLQTEFPSLFPSGVNPHSLKYAIWNFSAILLNNP